MPNTTKKSMSWGGIIFWLILFWPLGLFFLFRKIHTDRTASLNNGRTVAIVSYILIGAAVVYLIMAFEEGAGFIPAAILCAGGGIWLFVISRRMKATGVRYRKYIALVVNQEQKSIDAIATAMGISYEDAVKELQQMINRGYFAGAHIDVGSREIRLAKAPPPPPAAPEMPVTAGIPIQERVVACNSCGANIRVSGQVGECEYCGSPLQ